MSLEPLDDDLRDLFDRERQTYADDPAAARAALRRFEVTVAFAAVSGAAAAGALAAATAASATAGTAAGAAGTAARTIAVKKVVLLGAIAFVAGVGAGELHQVAMRGSDPSPRADVAAVTAPATVAAPQPSTPSSVTHVEPPPTGSALTVSPSALPDVRASSSPSSSPSPSPPALASAPPALGTTAPGGPSDLAAEQALIDTARAALARGRGDGALAATTEHASKFPRGRLAEERELLAVQALVLTGRRDEASARAARFRQAFPGSLFLPALDSTLAGPGPAGSEKKDSGR